MTNDHIPLPEYSQDDLNRAFEEALAATERLHKKFTSLAEDAGYVLNVLSTSKPQLDELYRIAQNDLSVYPLLASGVDFLRGLSKGLNSLEGAVEEFATPFNSMVNSTGTYGGTTDTGVVLFASTHELQPYLPPPNRKDRDYYAAKLKELNPTLANTYNQVWQTYYGTSSEPHRAALFMMRTLFDNFFAWLAPDEEVRNSSHWHIKAGEKPNQIWRSERLAYALEKNIEDDDRRNILKAEANQIGALYEAANEAHNREALDEDKASRTLMAMDSFLKDWLDALD